MSQLDLFTPEKGVSLAHTLGTCQTLSAGGHDEIANEYDVYPTVVRTSGRLPVTTTAPTENSSDSGIRPTLVQTPGSGPPLCPCGRVALFTCDRRHVCRACCADFLAQLNEAKR